VRQERGGTGMSGWLLRLVKVGAAMAVVSGGALAMTTEAQAISSTWSAQKAPLPAGALSKNQYAALNGVACPAGSCTAVGQYNTKSSQEGLIDTRATTTWTPTTAPIPAGGSGQELQDVACSQPGDCLALSYASPVIYAETSGSWSATTLAAPAGGSNLQLYAVGCWSAGCAAAGTYSDSSFAPQWAIATGSGSSWSVATAALPSLPSGYSLDVGAMSCHSSGTCESVGEYSIRPGPGPEDSTSSPVIVTGSSTAGWTATATRLPAGAEKYKYASTYPADTLSSVSCAPTSTSCVAFGGYTDAAFAQEPLIMDGTAPVEGPLPAGSTLSSSSFGGPPRVSCVSGSSCTIVGSYTTSSDAKQGMVITGAGKTWTLSADPVTLPPNASATNPQVQLTGVSCGSVSLCGLIGQYVDSSSNTHAMVLSGSGSTWAAQEAGAPIPNDGQISLADVSCSTHLCIAVGSYQQSSGGNNEGLIEKLG
jgi:hypothetical protein